MRVAFVTSGFSSASPRGLDQHSVSITRALQKLGLQVEVFAPRSIPGLAALAQRREIVDGIPVTWLNEGAQASDQDWAQALLAFVERESPSLVHLDWLPQDGLAAVEALTSRGIACLHHGHDYSGLGEDRRALSGDLRSFDGDDWEARARGVLVRAVLDQHPALGKHDGLLLPDLVDKAFWEHVQQLISGPEAVGLDAARDGVHQFLERSRQAYQACHARFCNSEELGSQLESTLGATVDCVKPGVDLAAFAGLVPPRAGRGPIRFGYMGPLEKASGVHLLMDAFAGLEGRAELRLFGSGEDRPYLRLCRARAQEVGARWYGTLEPGDRAQALDRIDVLVVPTLWADSAPHEVREALAARRPVIVCDLEATAVGVFHEQNGLRFAAGDLGALRQAMNRFVEEPELLQILELGITPPRDIAEEAREWADVYTLCVASGPKRLDLSDCPPHLHGLASNYARMSELSTRELFDRVARGLGGLSTRMGVELEPSLALLRAVAAGGHGRDTRLAYERIHQWLEGSAEELQLGREALLAQQAQLQHEREEVSDKAQTLQVEWQEQGQEAEELRSQLEAARVERDLAHRRANLVEEETERRLSAQRREHQDMIQRDGDLRRQLAQLSERMLTSAEAPEMQGDALAPQATLGVLASLQVLAKRNEEELAWRRAEMAKAKGASSGLLARLTGGDASALMREWDDQIPSQAPAPASTASQSETPSLGFRSVPLDSSQSQNQPTHTSDNPAGNPADKPSADKASADMEVPS